MKKPPGAIKLRPHATFNIKRFPWPICRYCGLVYLKNELTKKAIREGCWLWEDEK